MKNLIIASLVSVLTVFVITFLVTLVDSLGTAYSNPLISISIAGIAALVSTIVVVVWAIPLHLLLSRFKKLNVSWYLLGAVVPAFFFIYAFKPFGNDTNSTLFIQALICTLYGSLGALSFWYIAVYRQRIVKN